MSWSRGRSASTRPDSTMRLPRSARFTVPVTSDSPRSRKSLRICSRSASRIFCRITCLAACAPMRPKVSASSGSSITSPRVASAFSATASVMAIWCAGSSCSSSGTTVQRRNAWYSPLSRSISTRTSTSSLKRFLVADASAISRARNTVSLPTLFSRDSASTSTRISLLTLSLRPSHVRHQPGAVDVLESNMLPRAIHFQHDPPLLDALYHAVEAAPPAQRQLELDAHALPLEPAKILQPLERTVESRRRDLEPFVIDPLHGERAREMLAHALAIVERDSARRIDEDPQQPGARAFQVHELVAEAFERAAY